MRHCPLRRGKNSAGPRAHAILSHRGAPQTARPCSAGRVIASRLTWTIDSRRHRAILLTAPLYGGYLYLTATKESIGKQMKREDLASAEEVIRGDFAPAVDAAIVTSRDTKLVAEIDSLIASTNRPTTVGIVYGAGHMQAVTAALMEKHHYRVNGSEWLMVFDYASV